MHLIKSSLVPCLTTFHPAHLPRSGLHQFRYYHSSRCLQACRVESLAGQTSLRIQALVRSSGKFGELKVGAEAEADVKAEAHVELKGEADVELKSEADVKLKAEADVVLWLRLLLLPLQLLLFALSVYLLLLSL